MAGLAGSDPAADTSRRVLGVALWGREGSSRVRGTPVADPAIIRSLDVGQAAYIYRGGVTYVQVKRLVAAPAALAREPVAPEEPVGRAAARFPVGGQGTTHGPAARCRQPARRSVRQRDGLRRRRRDTLFRPFSIVCHAFTERAEGNGTHMSTVAGICLPGA